MIFILLILTTCFLAYANGANDNFKGVATLFGSRTANYRSALRWATITTFAGSVCSIFFARLLIKNFSGKGLVPDLVAGSPDFLLAVALGAGLTVILATFFGFPISTTHSLTGALAGAGLMAVGLDLNFSMLGKVFFLPLFVSPSIAVFLGAVGYAFFRVTRLRLGVNKEWCVCVGNKEKTIPIPQPSTGALLSQVQVPEIAIGKEATCEQRYTGRLWGINCQKLLDAAHFLSAGVVSFARGLNDTPKIVALLLAVKALSLPHGMLAVGFCMAIGGWLNARKVAETMSKKITPLNHGQGFTANLMTGLLVIFASRFGVPVSTTHVSCGSLFGIGLVTGRGNPKVISEIILSWVLTLPIAALLSGFSFWILTDSSFVTLG